MKRSTLGLVVAAAFVAVAGLSFAWRAEAEPDVRVYRSATCGCCKGWAKHLERNGFSVQVIDLEDLGAKKTELGIPRKLASCHTAEVGGFIVEGHVPASDVKRLLEERPDVRGLAVPDMPEGSPGMEGPNPERYTVWAFQPDGSAEAFAQHGP